MLEKSRVASHESPVAAHHDEETVADEEVVDDTDLASDLPF